IADLIGYPHYGEGIDFTVREWTYLFNLKSDDGWVQCQYKVLFDKDKKAQSFYWNPESCAALISGKQKPTTYTLGADALFNFDSAALRPEGETQLNQLAGKINGHQQDIASITVGGYTDRLGDYGYNLKLSQQRADSVRNYLIGQGVPASLITAEG